MIPAKSGVEYLLFKKTFILKNPIPYCIKKIAVKSKGL
jgi:hypothetical protein